MPMAAACLDAAAKLACADSAAFLIVAWADSMAFWLLLTAFWKAATAASEPAGAFLAIWSMEAPNAFWASARFASICLTNSALPSVAMPCTCWK